MANDIKLKRSATQGKVPTTAQLQLGELALNTHDGKLFLKKNDGTESIVEVGATDLGITTTTTSNTITSSTGDNATISEATSSAAGLMSTAHHDKLDGIEAGATADQTASEILTAIKTVDGAASGLDADVLDGQHGSYYLDYNNFTNTPAASSSAFTSYAIIEDQKGAGAGGGTFTSGAWRIRDLNTEVADPDGIVTLSSNEFTLGAGTYLIEWEAPAMRVSYHSTKLYDVTGASDAAYGTGEYSDNSVFVSNKSVGAYRVTLASSNTYRIEHRCNSTRSANGFGYTPSWGDGRFTKVKIWKE